MTMDSMFKSHVWGTRSNRPSKTERVSRSRQVLVAFYLKLPLNSRLAKVKQCSTKIDWLDDQLDAGAWGMR
jgi:hypothetical protein